MSSGEVKWSRKLYEKHDPRQFPDNYVDDSFLLHLQRNVNVPVYTLSQIIKDSGRITQQLSLILSFIACFLLILDSQLPVNMLLSLANVTSVLAYTGWVLYMRNEISLEHSKDRERFLRWKGRETIIEGLIFTVLLMALSPILKTLTEDTSSDTIWALSSLLFLLSFVSHDYSSVDTNAKPPRRAALIKNHSSPFSLNCAILASIALASRLESVTQVFGFLSVSVNIFAFFPILSRMIRRRFGSLGEFSLTFSSSFLTFFLWFHVFAPVAFIFCASVLFINFLSPFWLLHLQKYKK
jgi:phosphatidylinositol N-acetylglucosaminyltransferase subunit C